MVAEQVPFTQTNNGPNNGLAMATHQPAPNPADLASSAASTVGTENQSTSDSQQQITAMELAYAELERTVHEALELRTRPTAHPRLLQSHITALQEDSDLLGSFEPADDNRRTQATQLILRSRRLRRHLERDLIDLDLNTNDNHDQHIIQVVPLENKPPSIQLVPLKPPTFSGDAAQFRLFQNFYEENVFSNTQLTDTAKWLRLTESLSGAPAELISEIPQTSQTLSVAWNLLVDIYGGDDRPIVQLYERLQQLQPASMTTASLHMNHSKLEGILLSLQNLGHDVTENGYIKWVYMNKFPVDVAYQVQKKKNATLAELREGINEFLLARECVDQHSAGPSQRVTRPVVPVRPPLPVDRKKTSSSPTKPATSRPLRCVFCNGEHWNDVCSTYPSLEARRERLTGKCFICLRRQHTGTPCITQRRCFHCDSFDHNRALCPTKFQEPIVPPIVQAAVVSDEQVTSPAGFFLTFLAAATSRTVRDPIPVRVIIDTAGGATVIRREIVEQLQIQKTNEATQYIGLGDTKLASSYKLREPIQLQPPQGESIAIEAEMVEWIVPDVPAADVQQFRADHPQYNELHIPETGAGLPVDLLIGSDTLIELLTPAKIEKVSDTLFLVPTRFGSLILGRKGRQQQKVCHSLLFNTLKNPLHTMCNLDVVGLTGIHDTNIEEEQRAIQNFYDTVQFVEGRYSISWPWRCQPPELSCNFGLALGRLRSLYKRLQNSPQILHDYHSIIQQQLADGVIEKINLHAKTQNFVHYLPHHPVLQPGKSTALRPVYDGSAKSSVKSKSLNENILKGKNWLNDLIQTLLRFRRYETAVTADIAKAFHQISINENDRDVARFLWIKDISKPPSNDNLQAYRFTRVAFGIVASPFILSATIQHHANQQTKNEYTDILLRDLYADNLVAALPNTINPTEFYIYAKTFFSTMKMNLTKWTSNDEKLAHHIPSCDQLSEKIQSVLGLRWNRLNDTLSIKSPKLHTTPTTTRRTVAHEMAAYFDPLGWATPILLLAKAFFRKIWKETEKWDEVLAEQMKDEWVKISAQLKYITKIYLPRHFGLSDDCQSIQLHAFVDASAVAYAVVVYIRIQSSQSNTVMLLSSKSRLTPAKTVTIPRLELIAILLGARYLTFLVDALQLPIQPQTFVWSDSKCALTWTQSDKILPTAVEKFVRQIKTHKIDQYRYVPSDQNFADVATRGAEYTLLQNLNWWSGPKWLQCESHWPINELYTPENNVALAFQNKVTLKQTPISEIETEGVATLHIHHFSSLTKLLTRTAYVIQATNKFSKRNFLNTQTEIDVLNAEKLWIKWDQHRFYALEKEPDAGKEFLLRNITVFRDNDGIIRCTTRINNSVMDLDTKSPILLVRNSILTELLILHIHQLHKHAGTNHTLANIRRRYWLPHGYRQVYKVIIRKCYYCRRHFSNTYPNPPPAPLPEFRVVRSQRPFQFVGVDIFGPFTVRHIESTGYVVQKRWTIIFTCATIRAIHLETITQMTTEEISHSFRRFVSRRGVPQKFISDNAPQFHSLDGYFASLWHTITTAPSVSNYFAQNKIIWQFVTEFAPWMGGIYERLIQSVKVAFEKTYGAKTLMSRQFETAIIEIEAILNSRPISYINRDPETPILTPNDFLMATYSAIPVTEHLHQSDDVIKKLWKSSQSYLNEFWRNWADQYLLVLRERNDQLPQRTRTAKYRPQKGEIVVMQELGKKRSAWQMAVIERLIPSADEEIRSVQIRIPNGSRLIRPVISLAPLGMQMDLPDVEDNQLNRRKDAIIVWPRGDISQNDQNANELQANTQEEREEERSLSSDDEM